MATGVHGMERNDDVSGPLKFRAVSTRPSPLQIRRLQPDSCENAGRGRTKPTQRLRREYQRFGGEVTRKHGWWQVTFDPDSVRRYCVHVLLHEVGHHIDLVQVRLSAANRRRREEAAEQYAVRFAKTGAHEVAGLERRAAADASS